MISLKRCLALERTGFAMVALSHSGSHWLLSMEINYDRQKFWDRFYGIVKIPIFRGAAKDLFQRSSFACPLFDFNCLFARNTNELSSNQGPFAAEMVNWCSSTQAQPK